MSQCGYAKRAEKNVTNPYFFNIYIFKFNLLFLFISVSAPSLSWDVSSGFLHYTSINPSRKWVHSSDGNKKCWVIHHHSARPEEQILHI